MAQSPQPHISAALAHLRFGVTAAGFALAALLVAQVLVWAFVHFTDVRVTQLEAPTGERSFEVVQGARPAQVGSLSGVTPRGNAGASIADSDARAEQAVAGIANAAARTTADTAANPNVVESAADRMLRAAAAVVQTAGIVSAVLLILLLMQGVAVGGGGAVPGVEMAVTASTLAIVTALLSIPLVGVVPDAPFPGVFQSYDTLVRASMDYRGNVPGSPGAIGFYAGSVLMPLVLAGVASLAVLRFRAGVERGLISTTVSEAHERLEREIRSRKNLGELANSRAMGALNATMNQEMLAQQAVNLANAQQAAAAGQTSFAGPYAAGATTAEQPAANPAPPPGAVPLPAQPSGTPPPPANAPQPMGGAGTPPAMGAAAPTEPGLSGLPMRSILPDDPGPEPRRPV